jgi:hypothetical protein
LCYLLYLDSTGIFHGGMSFRYTIPLR